MLLRCDGSRQLVEILQQHDAGYMNKREWKFQEVRFKGGNYTKKDKLLLFA